MRHDLLLAAMVAGMSASKAQPPKRKIRVVDDPQFTTNMFGPITEIAGKELELLDRNHDGDCLCIFSGSKGTNLVDVDRRDVVVNNLNPTGH